MIKQLLKRPIGVTMCVIAIIILSVVGTSRLPVSLMPAIDIPQITVQVTASGMSVREVERSVMRPLKSQLSQVAGLKSIHVESKSDAGLIRMEFEPNANIDLIFIGVNEKLDRAASSLPDQVERPKIVKASVTDIPAFYLNLTFKQGEKHAPDQPEQPGIRFGELGQFARNIVCKRIEQLPQTAMVDVTGVVTPEYLCVPDQAKLTSMGVGIELLENAISSSNVSLGSLSIKDGQRRYNIHFDSKILTKEDIEEIYINHHGRVYQFKDLCRIIERPAPRNGLVRSNGKPAISMAIIKQNDARMSDLQESIHTLIGQLEKEYPEINFELTRDQTSLLSYSLSNLADNLLLGAFLAAVIIFFFMKDFRSPALIVFTIPLALIVTMLVFHLIGMSLNIISLSGLILGTGMMVDNSIIVIDNISQKWETEERLTVAIPKAVAEVFTPMLSSVLTTCSVFIPLIFLSGTAGALFFDQAMAITAALFSSLAVSVLVLPVYFFAMYKKQKRMVENAFIKKHLSFDFYGPYEAAMNWTLRHGRQLGVFFMLLVPALVIIYPMMEKSRLPKISHDDTLLTIDWNSALSLEENDLRSYRVLMKVDSLLAQSTSMVGVQQFLLGHTKDISTSESILYLKAHDSDELEAVKEVVADYFSTHYPTARYSFEASGNLFNMIFPEKSTPLIAELHSRDGNAPSVAKVEALIQSWKASFPNIQIPELVKEQNIKYVADAEAMTLYGIGFNDIHHQMKNIISQNTLFRINKGGLSIPVTTGENHAELSDILKGKVRNRKGVEVPLHLVIHETRSTDFKKLYSGAGGEYYPVPMNVDSRDVDDLMEQIDEQMKGHPDFFVTYSGDYFASRQLVKELAIILLVAISLLYFILAAQFESVVQPFIILSEIVVDVLVVLIGLWFFGESLNIMSMIGLIVMSGIVINDSILKVDTINRLRKEGLPTLKAVIVGGHNRLKPIIMTSLTTILAIVPFLNHSDMGSDLQYPLSLAIIIGMFVGTLVSLYFVPLVYYLIYRNK